MVTTQERCHELEEKEASSKSLVDIVISLMLVLEVVVLKSSKVTCS